MRALKVTAILMVVLVVLALLLVGYFFLTAQVSIVAYDAKGVQASQQVQEFDKIKASVEDGTFMGTLYGKPELGNAEDYALITYTLRLSNQCLVPIDMIEVQVVPQPGDILQLGDQTVHALNPKTQGDVSATVLVPKDSHSVRELIVTYYVWGVSFSLKTTYGG